MTISLKHTYNINNSDFSLFKTNNFALDNNSANNKTGISKDSCKQDLNTLETFQNLTNYVEKIDSNINNLSDTLNVSFNVNDQKEKIAEIDSLMTEKSGKIGSYSDLQKQMVNNPDNKAKISITNNFNNKADLSTPDEKQMIENDANTLNDWDKLRSLSRNDLKNMITRTSKDEMVNVLYEVPKYELVKSLRQISKEQKLEILEQNHFAEALIREIPKPELVKSLPNNSQLLPNLMKMSNTKSPDNTSQDSKDINKLNDREQQQLKKSILNSMNNYDLRQLNFKMGISAKEIAKNIPNNVLNKQLGDLNKPQCIKGFKILDQNQIMDNLKGFSSVKLAKVTMDVVDSISINENYINNNYI